jgi:hypothetical protein
VSAAKPRITRKLPTHSCSGKSTGGAGTNLPLMKPDDVPPDVPPASLNSEKDPDEWVTKDEPTTGPQRSYLQTLCREAGEEFNEAWTKAEASKRIDELQQKTGRGKSGTANS